MIAVPLGVYVPGDSVVHRMKAGHKFIVLLLFIIGQTLLVHSVYAAVAALAMPTIGYLVARIPPKVAWTQLAPPLPILLSIFAFQWWQQGLASAATTVVGIYAAIAAATLLTLTTRVGAVMDALESGLQPLARFGVPVHTITLAISLTIRLIPLQLATIAEVLDARKARGAEFSLLALGAPVIIRSIRRAQYIGDALLARGAAD